MYSGVSRKYLSAFGKKFCTFSEKVFAPGDCGSLISAGRSAGLSHSIFCGALHPAQVSIETVSITAKRSDLVLCFNKLCIVLFPLFGSGNRGRQLSLGSLCRPMVVRLELSDNEADEIGGQAEENGYLHKSSLAKSMTDFED